jgi:hypothetical protein
VLQIESDQVCQTGLDEEPELHWRQDQAAALLPCQNIKHTFARIARECTDVHFFSINVGTTKAATGGTLRSHTFRAEQLEWLGWPSLCSRHHLKSIRCLAHKLPMQICNTDHMVKLICAQL